MILTPLRKEQEIASAFDEMSASLKQGSKRFKRYLGWQGGGRECTIYWRPTERFWSVLDPLQTKNRYWCGFGITNPTDVESLSIICEVNPPFRGIDRRIAGIFLQDHKGQTFLAHSGRVGGGRKGIGKKSFLAGRRGDNIETVRWPDGRESQAIVIGRVDAQHLPAQLAHFVREVARFKNSAIRGSQPKVMHERAASFTPEFSGKRKGYKVTGEIESQCDHGLVIDSLVELLERKGILTKQEVLAMIQELRQREPTAIAPRRLA